MPALPDEIACDDFGLDRDAALSNLRDGLLRECSFVSEPAQADADSKED
jgi:hypothetical protein